MHPTCELRFVVRRVPYDLITMQTKYVLQQKFINDDRSEFEWRDVPLDLDGE